MMTEVQTRETMELTDKLESSMMTMRRTKPFKIDKLRNNLFRDPRTLLSVYIIRHDDNIVTCT